MALSERSITTIKGVGEKRAALFAKIGASTIGELLRLYPRVYEDWSRTVSIQAAVVGEVNIIRATVVQPPSEHRIRKGMLLYKVLVTDEETDMVITFFNNKYIPSLLRAGETYVFRGKVPGNGLAGVSAPGPGTGYAAGVPANRGADQPTDRPGGADRPFHAAGEHSRPAARRHAAEV